MSDRPVECGVGRTTYGDIIIASPRVSGVVVLGLKMGSKERTIRAADTMAPSFGHPTQ